MMTIKKTLMLILFTSPALFAGTLSNSGVSFLDAHSGYVISSSPTVITQNTDTATITALNSVACPIDNDSFYRRFDLDGDHGIVNDLNVTSIDFGVETTTGNAVTGVDVSLYSIANTDPLLLANLTLIGTVNVPLVDGTAYVQNAIVSGFLNGSTHDLVVEIFSPDTTNGTIFFPGSNANGQSAPSYLYSGGSCGIADITDLTLIGFPDMHTIMVVNANAASPPLIPTLSFVGLLLLIMGMLFVYNRAKITI